MSVPQLLDEMAGKLRAVGIESPRREARLLLSHALGLPADSLVLTGAPTHLPEDVTERLLATFKRRVAREPLAYVLGRKEFWSMDFAVGPGVLVPRPETETLVEQALNDFDDRCVPLSVLDLGTGSGCLLLSFLAERPNARGVGIDASDEALSYARANAATYALEHRATLEERDWSDGVEGSFDVIFVNPPYLTNVEFEQSDPEVRAEPRAALAAGTDGLLTYRVLAPIIGGALSPHGHAFVELGLGQEPDVRHIFSSSGVETIRVVPDLSDIPRCLVLAVSPEKGQKPVGNPKESG